MKIKSIKYFYLFIYEKHILFGKCTYLFNIKITILLNFILIKNYYSFKIKNYLKFINCNNIIYLIILFIYISLKVYIYYLKIFINNKATKKLYFNIHI